MLAATIFLTLLAGWPLAAWATDPPSLIGALWVEERRAAGLRWLEVPGATAYIVLRRDSESGDLQPIARVTVQEYFDATVRPGVTFWYAVQTVAGAEASAPGEERRVAVPGLRSLAPPAWVKAEPEALREFGKTSYRARLEWMAKDGASFYVVYRSVTPALVYTQLVRTVEPTYVDTAVEPGRTYRYVVAAADHSQESQRSEERTVLVRPSPPEAVKRPARPQLVPRPSTLLWEITDRPSGMGDAKARLPLGDAFDLAFDAATDLLYVSSTYLRQILVLRASDGELLRRLGPRLGEHEIGVPLGLDVDRAGNLFVVDGLRGLVVVLTPVGAVRRVLTPQRAAGDPAPRLVDVAVLGDGTAHVTDNATGRVVVFDGAGREARRWQMPGRDTGLPTGITKIAAAAEGNLVITDGWTPQIYLCSPEGERLASFGERRSGVDGLPLPADVAPLADGHLLVADLRTAKILEFASETGEGVYRAILANSRGDGPARGEDPLAVASGSHERIFVLDFLGNRLGAFRLGVYGEPR